MERPAALLAPKLAPLAESVSGRGGEQSPPRPPSSY